MRWLILIKCIQPGTVALADFVKGSLGIVELADFVMARLGTVELADFIKDRLATEALADFVNGIPAWYRLSWLSFSRVGLVLFELAGF